MGLKLGVTQWCIPGKGVYGMDILNELNLHYLHLDLGGCSDGYPLTQMYIQDRYLEDAKKYDINIISLALNDLCSNCFVKLGECRDIAYETMRLGVKVANEMGVSRITVPNFVNNEINSDDDFNATVEALKFLCNLAEPLNIDIYTENVLLPEKLYKLFEAVNAPNLKLLYDSQNYNIVKGYDSADILDEIYGKVDLGDFVHLKDGCGDMSNRYLGEGDCNIQKNIEVLKKNGYDGVIILENNYYSIDIPADKAGNRFYAIEKDIKTVTEMFNI